jgi:LacI family transcriptional regulator
LVRFRSRAHFSPVEARRWDVSGQVTLADVARWAGVSLATASRALHGGAGRTVGPDLRARVRAAAAELNYSPNANARAIVRGTTTTVGLIVHDIADPSAAALASGVMAAATERDLIVTIASTLSDPFVEIRHVEALRRQRARAVILAGSRFNDVESMARLAEELLGDEVGKDRRGFQGQCRQVSHAPIVTAVSRRGALIRPAPPAFSRRCRTHPLA